MPGRKEAIDRAATVKVCLAASAGGHLTQLIRLTPACQDHDYFIVTTAKTEGNPQFGNARTYHVGWANRNHPYLVVKMLFHCRKVLMKERPDVLISTGAAVGGLLAFLMKLAGKKIIWIDTISHTEYLTLSGHFVKYFADIFLVQWPELAEKYDKAKYVGSVI